FRSVRIAASLAAFAGLVLTLPRSVPPTDAHASDLVLGLSFAAMGTIGIVLLTRRPENAVGWLLAAGAVLLASAQIGPDYLVHWLYGRDVAQALVAPLM